MRITETKDGDADADEREGEERANVREVDHLLDVGERSEGSDDQAGDDGGDVRRAEARVNARKNRGKESVAGHGEEDARLAHLENEEDGGVCDNGTEGDDTGGPRGLRSNVLNRHGE